MTDRNQDVEFQYLGDTIRMTRWQYDQTVRVGAICRCRSCISCRAFAVDNTGGPLPAKDTHEPANRGE